VCSILYWRTGTRTKSARVGRDLWYLGVHESSCDWNTAIVDALTPGASTAGALRTKSSWDVRPCIGQLLPTVDRVFVCDVMLTYPVSHSSLLELDAQSDDSRQTFRAHGILLLLGRAPPWPRKKLLPCVLRLPIALLTSLYLPGLTFRTQKALLGLFANLCLSPLDPRHAVVTLNRPSSHCCLTSNFQPH
jgi:hypothetical protein